MGSVRSMSPAMREYYRQQAAETESKRETKRMALADKIVLALVDEISAAIVRPGPKPEERECYVVAQELREHSPALAEIVRAIIRIEEDEGHIRL